MLATFHSIQVSIIDSDTVLSFRNTGSFGLDSGVLCQLTTYVLCFLDAFLSIEREILKAVSSLVPLSLVLPVVTHPFSIQEQQTSEIITA